MFFVVSAVFGGNVADRLGRGGLDDPDAESTLAREGLERGIGAASRRTCSS